MTNVIIYQNRLLQVFEEVYTENGLKIISKDT